MAETKLQRHLTLTEDGIRAARGTRQLLQSKNTGPLLFASTIWPDNLRALQERPSPAVVAIGGSVIGDVLSLTSEDHFAVPDHFSASELGRAALESEPADPRLGTALRTAADARVTQVLSGGVRLVQRMRPAVDHSVLSFSAAERAIITTAAELRRIGYPNPLPRWALEGASPAYLDPAHLVRSRPGSWFALALDAIVHDAELDDPISGTATLDVYQRGVPALRPRWTANSDPTGDDEAYELHDFLLEQHLREEGARPTAAAMWQTLTAAAAAGRIPGKIATVLGLDALARGLLTEALALLTTAVIDGQIRAVAPWIDAVELRNGLPELVAMARAGNRAAADRAASILSAHGDVATLRELAEQPNLGYPREALDDLLAQRGDIDELRRRAPNDGYARYRLSQLVARTVATDELLARARDGDPEAFDALEVGSFDELDGLRDAAATGDASMALVLAVRLAEEGRLDELNERAESGDKGAEQVQSVIRRRGTPSAMAELSKAADAGDPFAQAAIAQHLAQQPDLTELRARASQGEPAAQRALVDILHGQASDIAVEELRRCVHNTYAWAARALLDLYRQRSPRTDIRELNVEAEPRET